MMTDLLPEVARIYELPVEALRPLTGGHFAAVYGFGRAGRNYVLRITPTDADIDLEATRAILEWMRFLVARGGGAPRPVLSPGGAWVETLETAKGRHLVTVLEQARGDLSETLGQAQWSEALYQRLGQAVGRMHALAKDYVPAAGMRRRPEWDQGGNLFSPAKPLTGTLAALNEKREQALRRLAGLPKDRDVYGLVHADLHFGNFFVEGESGAITFIDFDDCAYGWFVMDVAMLLFDSVVLYARAAGAEKEDFAERFLRAFMNGYLPENPLGSFWLRQLPHFLKLLEINVYALVYGAYTAGTDDDWIGKFMPGRQARLENDVPYVGLDFERFAAAYGD